MMNRKFRISGERPISAANWPMTTRLREVCTAGVSRTARKFVEPPISSSMERSCVTASTGDRYEPGSNTISARARAYRVPITDVISKCPPPALGQLSHIVAARDAGDEARHQRVLGGGSHPGLDALRGERGGEL